MSENFPLIDSVPIDLLYINIVTPSSGGEQEYFPRVFPYWVLATYFVYVLLEWGVWVFFLCIFIFLFFYFMIKEVIYEWKFCNELFGSS